MTQIETFNPATEARIATYDYMSEAAAVEIVQKRHASHLDWHDKSHDEREVYLTDIAEALHARAEDFDALMTDEIDKLLRAGLSQVEMCARIFEFSAKHGPQERADEKHSHWGGKKQD